MGKKRKAPASGVRAAKLAKAKRGPVRRRETRAARKRRREEAGDGDGEEDLVALSGGELDVEELAGDPTESEFEAVPGPTAAAGPSRAAAETGKMCAGDKVRHIIPS